MWHIAPYYQVEDLDPVSEKEENLAPVSDKEALVAEFWASNSFAWRSACSLSHWVIPIMMSSMVPVVPKNTSGPKDFLFIPTGMASKAPATENTQVPNALQINHGQ